MFLVIKKKNITITSSISANGVLNLLIPSWAGTLFSPPHVKKVLSPASAGVLFCIERIGSLGRPWLLPNKTKKSWVVCSRTHESWIEQYRR